MNLESKTLKSGGARGADTLFGQLALSKSHRVQHYYVEGCITPKGNTSIPLEESKTYDDIIIQAAKNLGRRFPTNNEYVNSLLRRNMWQILDTQHVFAVGLLDDKNEHVLGGTGWAIEYAKMMEVPITFFDQNRREVYNFDVNNDKFYNIHYSTIPAFPQVYTGIGTRELNNNGINYINFLYNDSRTN